MTAAAAKAALARGTILAGDVEAKLFQPGRLDDGSLIDDGDGSGYGMGWEKFQTFCSDVHDIEEIVNSVLE